jgi:hypothetical protein
MDSRPNWPSLSLALITALLLAPGYASDAWCQGFQGVLTYHNDDARTGQNFLETVFAPSKETASVTSRSRPISGHAFLWVVVRAAAAQYDFTLALLNHA